MPQVSIALRDINQRYGTIDLGRTTHELVRSYYLFLLKIYWLFHRVPPTDPEYQQLMMYVKLDVR